MKEHLFANVPSGKQLHSERFSPCSLKKYITTSQPHILTEIIHVNIPENLFCMHKKLSFFKNQILFAFKCHYHRK